MAEDRAAVVGEGNFGVKAVWTQLAIRCAANAPSLLEFELMTAKLAAWNYVNIVWNPATLIAAGAASDWNTGDWPFSKCMGLLKDADLHVSAKAPIVMEFLRQLRRSDCIELKQTAVIHAVLDAVGDVRALRAVYQRLDETFRVDFPSAEFVRLAFDVWRKH